MGSRLLERRWRPSAILRITTAHYREPHNIHSRSVGEFEITMDGPDGDPVTVPGKFFDLLERQSDGRWLARIACWNSNQPAG